MRMIFLVIWVAAGFHGMAQYYTPAFGLNGAPLKTALHNIITGHTTLAYSDLWSAFQQTDKKANGEVWDIYTDVPGGSPSIVFQFGTDQCGNYNAEGDCYNREHTWPKEKFGGDNSYPMYSDLHHVYPTDGWVNNKRAAFPYGEVTNITYTSISNSSLLGDGNCYPGYSDKIFEPIDSFKGDLARTYFYMSTRYEGEDAAWDNWVMANGAALTPDAVTLLMSWHHSDPVSQKEVDRNEAIYLIQANRNPFIDYPVFADCIWGTTDCAGVGFASYNATLKFDLYPNPVQQQLFIECEIPLEKIRITDISGKTLIELNGNIRQVSTAALRPGTYLLQVQSLKGKKTVLFTRSN